MVGLIPCHPDSRSSLGATNHSPGSGGDGADPDADSAYSLNRRSSSGGLLSPEVDMSGSTTPGGSGGKPGETCESDGFYMLKKDSQRRTTLSKVLSQDEAKICAVWMDKIENNHKVQVVITRRNLEIMIRALRDYIMEQNREILETAMGELKLSLDFDSTAIDHLHLALYSFQVSAKKLDPLLY